MLHVAVDWFVNFPVLVAAAEKNGNTPEMREKRRKMLSNPFEKFVNFSDIYNKIDERRVSVHIEMNRHKQTKPVHVD